MLDAASVDVEVVVAEELVTATLDETPGRASAADTIKTVSFSFLKYMSGTNKQT